MPPHKRKHDELDRVAGKRPFRAIQRWPSERLNAQQHLPSAGPSNPRPPQGTAMGYRATQAVDSYIVPTAISQRYVADASHKNRSIQRGNQFFKTRPKRVYGTGQVTSRLDDGDESQRVSAPAPIYFRRFVDMHPLCTSCKRQNVASIIDESNILLKDLYCACDAGGHSEADLPWQTGPTGQGNIEDEGEVVGELLISSSVKALTEANLPWQMGQSGKGNAEEVGELLIAGNEVYQTASGVSEGEHFTGSHLPLGVSNAISPATSSSSPLSMEHMSVATLTAAPVWNKPSAPQYQYAAMTRFTGGQSPDSGSPVSTSEFSWSSKLSLSSSGLSSTSSLSPSSSSLYEVIEQNVRRGLLLWLMRNASPAFFADLVGTKKSFLLGDPEFEHAAQLLQAAIKAHGIPKDIKSVEEFLHRAFQEGLDLWDQSCGLSLCK